MKEANTSRTAVDAAFAGRRRTFRLRIGEMGELERLCDAGIGEIMLRLASHRFRVSDIRETIRLGLEGGGMAEPEATALVMRYVDDEPLSDHLQIAADILSAAVSGVPIEPGNADREGPSTPATSPVSTPPEAPSASDLPTSTA